MTVMSLYPYLQKPKAVDPTAPVAQTAVKYEPLWVFDDENAGLKGEAFVSGMSEMITAVLATKQIPNAADGFKLSFSDAPFDHDLELDWTEHEVFKWDLEIEDVTGVPTKVVNEKTGKPLVMEMAGNWYEGDVNGVMMEGWLCPALLLYFKQAPKKLYVKAEPLPEGVDPIWHDFDLKGGRRFVGIDNRKSRSLEDLLEDIYVNPIDTNAAGWDGWHEVIEDDETIAYFSDEVDAEHFRLSKINRILNP